MQRTLGSSEQFLYLTKKETAGVLRHLANIARGVIGRTGLDHSLSDPRVGVFNPSHHVPSLQVPRWVG